MSDIVKIRNQIKNYYKEKKEAYLKEKDNRRNNKWNKYYQSTKWKDLRDYYYKLHPVCENCSHYGRVVPAEEIHHRQPFSTGKTETDRWNLLLNPYNLIALCKDCHLEYHKELSKGNRPEYIEPVWYKTDII